MGRSVPGFSENENVPSEIEDGVNVAGIGERSGNGIGEISLADRSEIELHPLRKHDFGTADFDVFKIRPRRRVRFLGHEKSRFEILRIPEKGDVEKRIEIALGLLVAIARNAKQIQKPLRNVEASGTVQNGKGRIRDESGKLGLEIRDDGANRLHERVKAPVAITENRNDEQGPEGAEGVIEFGLQRTTLRF